MLRVYWGVVLCALALALSFGCKRSAEDERASWDRNAKKVKELMTLYPGFEPALEERLKSATAIYEAAEGLGEEEAAKKMSAANSALMKGFVGKLGGLDKEVKALRAKVVDAATASGDENDRLGVKVVADDARRTLDQVDAALKAGAKDVASAEVVVKKVVSDLEATKRNLDKVIGSAKGKKTAQAAAKAEDKAAAEKKEAAKQPWTCEYCSSSNAHTHTRCESCGAARSAAKK